MTDLAVPRLPAIAMPPSAAMQPDEGYCVKIACTACFMSGAVDMCLPDLCQQLPEAELL